ncbi:transcription factor bHLH53-like [Capsicum chacoense]
MASLSYYAASKLEPNVQEFNSGEMNMQMQLPAELLFDFNYDFGQNFYVENPDEACYFDPFFNPDEFILPVETIDNSCFMPEFSDLESTPKRQKVFQDNFLPENVRTPSHNSCFMSEYSDFESTPKRQKVFQDNCLPNNTIPPSQNSTFVPEYSIFESTPKRQKVFQDNCLPSNNLFNWGFVPPNPPIFQDFSSYSLPEIPMPVFSSGCCDNNAEVVAKKGGSSTYNEKKMSAQSIAARQRRKKITEKTQELGKLIPGGHRMNTAEMLQATFEYIKFLQAQAGLLEFMGSYKENEKSFDTPDLHKLVGSSLIQEKLYSSEKCLVPKGFLEALQNNQEFQNSQGIEEIKSLIK